MDSSRDPTPMVQDPHEPPAPLAKSTPMKRMAKPPIKRTTTHAKRSKAEIEHWKRKAEWETSDPVAPRPKRISPDPLKKKKDALERVLSITASKLRKICDPERCLHRAVLLKNVKLAARTEARALIK